METLNEQMKSIEEAGDMHSPGCCCTDQFGCDTDVKSMECCDNMRFLNREILTAEERGRTEAYREIEEWAETLAFYPEAKKAILTFINSHKQK